MKSDNEFFEGPVSEVRTCNGGWSVTFSGTWTLFVTDTECKEAPRVGETIRYYGRGIGYTVRGVAIGGRIYRYQSRDDHEAEQSELRERLRREREEEEARFRASEKPPVAVVQVARHRELVGLRQEQ